MQNVLKSGAAALVLIGVGACASTPEPEAPTPAPVAETPAPAPVRTEPAPAPAPVQTGPLSGSIEDFRVNVGERVYFDLDQWRLDDTDKAILQRQAAWLQSYPRRSHSRCRQLR